MERIICHQSRLIINQHCLFLLLYLIITSSNLLLDMHQFGDRPWIQDPTVFIALTSAVRASWCGFSKYFVGHLADVVHILSPYLFIGWLVLLCSFWERNHFSCWSFILLDCWTFQLSRLLILSLLSLFIFLIICLHTLLLILFLDYRFISWRCFLCFFFWFFRLFLGSCGLWRIVTSDDLRLNE